MKIDIFKGYSFPTEGLVGEKSMGKAVIKVPVVVDGRVNTLC